MRSQYLVTLLVLLALVVPSAPAHASGIVSICDEMHLLEALSGGGTVAFSCNGTIILTQPIAIAASTTIDGSGQAVTISGNHVVRVLIVNSKVALNLNALTIADGYAADGGGGGIVTNGTLTVSNSTFSGNGAGWGGAICTSNALTVTNSIFSGNTANDSGGGIYSEYGTMTVDSSAFSGNSAGWGGGIITGGLLTVTNSTFSSNTADDYGGGIYTPSPLTVSSSTFSGNDAYNGGGIYSRNTLTVSNSTFSGNAASHMGGGIYNYHGAVETINSTFSGNSASYGGGIVNNAGIATLKNTIVANSPAGENCSGAITDGGGNLSYSDATCPGINADPLLGPLQDNDGPTHTMALLSGSAALDAAHDATCMAAPVNNLDQRGAIRPQGRHCDIGAYEAASSGTLLFLPLIIKPSSP